MKSPDYWKRHYLTAADASAVERSLSILHFTSGADRHDLLSFTAPQRSRNILLSPGTAGHAYVFAELAYFMHASGYNTFIMPRQGGYTVSQLVERHREALQRIAGEFGPDINAYGEGLGGYVVFYLALDHAPLTSIVCQNSPAILTDEDYQRALVTDGGPWRKAARRRKAMIPLGRRLARLAPGLRIPISSYLPFKDLVDYREESRDIERRLVVDGYLKDPDFDRWYPLAAVASLLNTPPPAALTTLATPTMFIVASEGPTPEYIADLYGRLPGTRKELVRIDGSVYWMLSHPRQAAQLICSWFGRHRPRSWSH